MASLNSYGAWALVTGASAGIGVAFARALAATGMNVALTARREDRLRTLANELETRRRVQTRVVPLDLAADGAPERLAAATRDLEIGFLVNNAGFGIAGRFEHTNHAKLIEMVRLNCVAVAALAHLYLPPMQARRRGAMVILASTAGYQPLPLAAAYGATKAFDLMLGEALWAENRERGVDVLAVSPGPVDTEFQMVAGETPHPGATPQQVVDTAFAALGRRPSVIVGPGNAIRAWSVRLAPRALVARMAEMVMRRTVPREAS